MNIVRLVDEPYTRYLRQHIFHPIAAHHRLAKQYIEHACKERQAEHGERLPLFFRPKLELMGVELVWRSRVKALLQEVTDEIGRTGIDPADGAAAQQTMLNEMRNCLPAASIWNPEPLIKTTCRKYAVCPWCRYRWAEDVILKLLPLLAEHKHIATTTLSVTWEYVQTNHPDIAYLLNRLCNRSRCWPRDVVMTLPQFDTRAQAWLLHINIIALTDDTAELDDPEALVDVLSWQRREIPPIGGTRWHLHRATKKDLYNAVARAASYSVMLLFKYYKTIVDGLEDKTPMDATTFLALADITKLFRTKYHGLR